MKPLDNRNVVMDIRASSRADRHVAALQPDYFRVDERQPHDLVEFAAKFFRHITYYNGNGRPDGDWSPFFEDDPVIALFLIRSYNTENLKKRYVVLFRHLNRSKSVDFRIEMLERITQDVLHGLRNIEAFYTSVAPFKDFHQRFTNLIRLRLSKVLTQFMLVEKTLAELGGADPKESFSYHRDFSKEWFEAKPVQALPEGKEERVTELTRGADEQAYNLFYSFDELRRDADSYLETNVKESGEVKAHIGLLLTFLDLYRLAQDKINTFTRRHLDYYYDSVLNIRRLGRSYGEAYVVLKLAEAATAQELKIGTLFPAGPGKNETPVLYALKDPLIVNAAAIQTIIGVECNHAWEEKSQLPAQPFPFRSYYQAGTGHIPVFSKDVNTASHGYGFAISSPLLAQQEGDRKFSFHLTFHYDSFRGFLAACKEEVKRRAENEIGEEAARPEEEKMNALLKDIVKISCSTPEGWHEVPSDKADFYFSSYVDCRLQIDVLLETSDPPIGPVLDETYLLSFGAMQPVFRFKLFDDTSSVYSFLRLPVMKKMELEVEVSRIRNLLLRNDYGPVPIGAPFEMFGPQPRPGASFFLGHPALLSPLYDMRITLEWTGLPAVEGGFATHYSGYDYIRDNTAFKSVITTLRHNRWIPSERRPLIDLFQDSPEGKGILSPITRLNNFDLDALQLNKEEPPLTAPGPFPGTDKAGFIRFEFCYPPNGFGHADYPALVNEASQEMARRKKDIVPLPSEPYTPMLKSVLLDFKTKQEIHFGEDGNHFYQLYPYGKEYCAASEKRLVPFFQDGSTLLIGFTNLEDNSTLSLLTKINDTVSAVAPGVPDVRWSMFHNGQWELLSPDAFISDETSRLKRTGITRFEFLHAPKGDGHLYDNHLTWLKAESFNGFPFLALISEMYTHAGTIRLHSGEPLENVLLPDTIKALFDNNAAIESVRQPYASTGDRPEENREEWYSRISERLRHRGRAVTNWDYEHLVLQKFPEVQMTKCISHVSEGNLKAAGTVLVAVLPATDHSDDISRSGLFTLEKLQAIATYLEGVAPGDVRVKVVNPLYEKVRVKLRVKFVDGYDEVYYTRQLNVDLTNFLNPWKAGSGLQAKFGVSVSGFTILNFIENLYYVEFITNFNVFHSVKDKVTNLGSMASGTTEIIPSSPISILVSHQEHVITLFDGTSSDEGGINEMMIGTDFIMNADQSESSKGINFSKVGKDFHVSGKADQPPRPVGLKLKMKINA